MIGTLRELAVRFNSWLSNHWRMVIWCMLMVMMMQQCTISRLRWEVTQMTQGISRQSASQPAPAVKPDTAAVAAADTTAMAGGATQSGEEESAGLAWIAGLAIVIIAGAAISLVYMRRNAIYPVGITLRGKLKSDLTYHIKVANNSRKTVEVAEPLVVFIMGSGMRKFRANVPQLPLTLDKGTSFEADINLGGLIRANIDLANAKAINMSIETNGKRHSTLPTPVRIKTA